jgi:hypothetical protein
MVTRMTVRLYAEADFPVGSVRRQALDYCPIGEMGEKLSALGEDFSLANERLH